MHPEYHCMVRFEKTNTKIHSDSSDLSCMSVNSCNPSYADSLYLIVHCLIRNHLTLPCYVSTCFMPLLCNEPPIKIFQIDVWIHDLLQRVGRREFVSYRRCWMWSRPYGLCQERPNMQEHYKEFRPQSMQQLICTTFSQPTKQVAGNSWSFFMRRIWMCSKFVSFLIQDNVAAIIESISCFPLRTSSGPSQTIRTISQIDHLMFLSRLSSQVVQ